MSSLATDQQPIRDKDSMLPATFAAIGTVGTILASAAAAFLGAGPWTVVAIFSVLSIATWIQTRRFSLRERNRFNQIANEQSRELANWQQRWHEMQLETQEATSALTHMRDGVIILSGDARILMINVAARQLFGIEKELDCRSRAFSELVRIPELTQAIGAAIAGDGTQKLLIELRHNDQIIPIKVRVDRERDSGNSNLLVTVRDETESHRLDAMRREFVANISHELKTPLAAIKGYAETVELAIKDDPDMAVQFMTRIHGQCLRLERLVTDMMQLARAQSGVANLNLGAVSLDDAIAESLKSYRPIAEAKHVSLEYKPSDEKPVVWSDSEATLTIVNNLIGNAIRYTPAEGSVSVGWRDAGTSWALVVHDTGVGIAESDQKRIFERFYRVGTGRSTGDGGTGIGLSIVKNLAVTLGGEVRVASQPGKGAKFEVLLPKARKEKA